MAEHRPDAFAGVRRLFTGGDVVSPHHVNALLSRHPGLTVVNGYGPTENTTFTCCHLLREPLPAGSATVPIGTPVAGTRIFVVDRGGRPVPPACPASSGLPATASRRATWAFPSRLGNVSPSPAPGG
ncbi:AMP-binding protein [Streptomyces sp. NPDC002055]|uniref:AMP-binding protein n=1 Tax=Streptomyces sp. NPDC002055 TaxID=3154534 RepID=UPI00332AFCDF